MPFVVSCAACGKRLNIPDKLFEEKIRGHVVTIACKGCGADIKVDGTRPREEVDLSAGGAKPSPAADAVAPAGPPAPASPVVATASAAGARATAAVAPRTGGTVLGPAPAPAGQPAPEAAPAALPGLGGLPKPGAARAGVAARSIAESSPQAATPPAAPVAATPQAGPEPGGPGRRGAPQGKDFAKMTFPGTPTAMGRAGTAPVAPSRGFQPVAARPGTIDQPSDPGASASGSSTTVAEQPARRRGVPLGLRRTAPESPAARVAPGPEASASPTVHPTRHEGAGEGSGAAEPSATGAVSDWLWAVSFAEDDDRELTFAEVKAAILDRKVNAETIAWREGLSDWLPLGEIDVFRPVFAELARSPVPPRVGARPAVPGRGGEVAASGGKLATPAAAAVVGGAQAAAGEATQAAAPLPTPEGLAPAASAAGAGSAPNPGTASAPPAEDDREDWRRSTADLLAEIAGGTQVAHPGAPVGVTPVVPDPESLPPFPRPPAAPKFSLAPSLAPPKSVSRTIAYALVALLVLAALVGIVLLVVKGLAPSDDPTLRPATVPGPRASSSGPSSTEPAAPGESLAPATAPATSGSAGIDLARMVRDNVDRSGGTAGIPFDEPGARAVLAEAARRAALCRKPGDEKGPAKAAVTFDPATGRPSDVRLIGRYGGTGSGACIEATLRAVRTKQFSGAPVTLEQTVMLR